MLRMQIVERRNDPTFSSFVLHRRHIKLYAFRKGVFCKPGPSARESFPLDYIPDGGSLENWQEVEWKVQVLRQIRESLHVLGKDGETCTLSHDCKKGRPGPVFPLVEFTFKRSQAIW